MVGAGDERGDSSVVEALRGAANRLPNRPGAHLYIEDRSEERLVVRPGRPPETSALRTLGLAAVGERSIHVSDPALDELATLAEATGTNDALQGNSDRGDRLSGSLLPPSVGLSAWESLARELAGANLAVRIVGFRQIIWVVEPSGQPRRDDRGSVRLEVAATDGSFRTLHRVLGATGLSPSDIRGEVELSRRRRLDAAPIDGRLSERPAVFAPGAAGIVAHELVGHALEGDIALQKSRLAICSERVGPLGLRVVDDPRRGRCPWTIDDEGVSSVAVVLVEAGRVAGRLHDRASAAAAGSPVTGHGRRSSYLEAIRPRMGCTYIDRGDADPEEIVRSTSRGIYIRDLGAGHSDPWSGRSTFVVNDADLIEDGVTTRPLRPFMLVLDVIDALRSIDRIGTDLVFDACIGSCIRDGQPLVVSVGAPTLRIGVISAIV